MLIFFARLASLALELAKLAAICRHASDEELQAVWTARLYTVRHLLLLVQNLSKLSQLLLQNFLSRALVDCDHLVSMWVQNLVSIGVLLA